MAMLYPKISMALFYPKISIFSLNFDYHPLPLEVLSSNGIYEEKPLRDEVSLPWIWT